MQNTLDGVEIRVLGSLMEKELVTPEYYPLSLNALLNACNQKTNRSPVLSLDENTVRSALQTLKDKRIVYQSDASRVPKYWQAFAKDQDFSHAESALFSVLLLRGPQTAGELRSRADSMYPFESLEQVATALDHLITVGLVALLPRQPGQKEQRYVHLLAIDPVGTDQAATECSSRVDSSRPAEDDRLAALEQTVASLREELAELRRDFLSFKQHFE